MDATQMQRTHKAPELLSPAGTRDAFKAALAAGADAIYCGLGSFNARRNADNLDLDQLRECCELAHLAGARVYITVNILIAQEEMPRALALVHDCHLAGADAFIMADWGLISLTPLHPGQRQRCRRRSLCQRGRLLARDAVARDDASRNRVVLA